MFTHLVSLTYHKLQTTESHDSWKKIAIRIREEFIVSMFQTLWNEDKN